MDPFQDHQLVWLQLHPIARHAAPVLEVVPGHLNRFPFDQPVQVAREQLGVHGAQRFEIELSTCVFGCQIAIDEVVIHFKWDRCKPLCQKLNR